MADAGIAILGLALFYMLSKGKAPKLNGNGLNDFDISETPEELPLAIQLIRRDPTRTYTFVSKKTGEVTPGMYTRPRHIEPLLAKRAGIWIE